MNALLAIAPATGSIAATIEAALDRVEARFRCEVESPIRPVADLCHHIESYRGKMLRPMLVFLSGLAADPAATLSDDLVTVATVIEMIHMATLVHDDVIDEAGIRRGGDTVNKRRGNQAAVILGDYLISKSFHLCSSLDSQATALRVGEVTSIVCEGEMLQLAHRQDFNLNEGAYFEIIRRKTAALIALACELGALHGGASAPEARRFHDFGERLGIAFQIQDDLLDLVGEGRTVGKPVGKDLEMGTLTLPVIHALSRLDERPRAALASRLGAGANRALIRAELDKTGSIGYARSAAQRLVEEARALLDDVAESPAREALLGMADAVICREL